MPSPKRIVRGLLIAHGLFGAATILALLLIPAMRLGPGGLGAVAAFVEDVDFRWPLLMLALLLWLTPLAIAGAASLAVRYQLLDKGALEMVTDMLRDRTFPVTVHIDQRLPILFDEELRLPIKLRTHVDIERDIEIETTVPIHTNLEVDTTVAPNVMGLGSVKIPIRTTVPIHMNIPIKMPVHISLPQLPVAIDEVISVRLPQIEAPIDARLHMKIKLFEGTDPQP